MASNRRVDRARIDRWEAALADYLTRQPRVPGSSMRAEDEPRIIVITDNEAILGGTDGRRLFEALLGAG